MKHIKIILMIITFLFTVTFASNCEVGIVKIAKGVWVNKTEIYANIEKCFADNPDRIRELKISYNQSAEENIRDYEVQKAKYTNLLPKLIESSQKINFTPEILGYFKDSITSGQKLYDSLKSIQSLKKKDIENCDAWDLQRWGEFIEKELWSRYLEYSFFQELLRTPPPVFSSDEIHIPLFGVSLNRLPNLNIDNQSKYILVYSHFIKKAHTCKDFKKYLELTNNNEVLQLLFHSVSNYGNRTYYDTTLTNPDTLKNSIQLITNLTELSTKSIFENAYLFDNIIRSFLYEIREYHEQMVIKKIEDSEKLAGYESFVTIFPPKLLRPVMKIMERYGRDLPWKDLLGDGGATGYQVIKNIYNGKI